MDRNEMPERLRKIRQRMLAHDINALFVEDAANVRYLSGFKGEPAALWVTQEAAILFTSYRSEPWAAAQTETFDIVPESDSIPEITRRIGTSKIRIGTDPSIAYARFMELRHSWPSQVVEPVHDIHELRRIKSEAEIALLKESQRVNEQIFERILECIRPGMTERGAQGIILQEMARNEAIEGPSFTPIVAAGKNAWEIHHIPDNTILKEGDMVIIDHGVMVKGYASDMTRTICLGRATDRMRSIHAKVREAQLCAIGLLNDGIPAVELDAAARRIIEEAGHDRGYTHGLGHGIGLETHDAGLRMSPASGSQLLRAGMVLTIEPGIYLENEFGVRTEDMLVVQKYGADNLTKTTHDLIELTD